MNGTFLLTLITSVLCENFVVHQLLGLEYAADDDEHSGYIFFRSILTAVAVMAASVVSFLLDDILGVWGASYLNLVIFVGIMSGVELTAAWVLGKIRPDNRFFKGSVRVLLNSAVVAVIVTAVDCVSLQESLALGLTAAVGLLLVSLIFLGIRERLEQSDIPEAFRGVPILVLAAGLCAMIFTGFTGLSF